MKFFPKFYKNVIKKKKNLIFTKHSVCDDIYTLVPLTTFFLKSGGLKTTKILFSNLFKKINYFIYFNRTYLYQNFNIGWIFDNFFEKRLNYQNVFTPVIDLIKSPFSVKSVLISKKIKKKTKIKYAVKIVYKSEDKRIRNTFKQLYYYSNKFTDNKFNIRLYKSLFYTLLDWKQSHIFKLKTMVFKKFFKF